MALRYGSGIWNRIVHVPQFAAGAPVRMTSEEWSKHFPDLPYRTPCG